MDRRKELFTACRTLLLALLAKMASSAADNFFDNYLSAYRTFLFVFTIDFKTVLIAASLVVSVTKIAESSAV